MEIEYFNGEKIKISKKRDIENKNVSESVINEKYSKGEIRIVTEQARYQLTSIPEMVNSPDYILNPEFQRRHRWNNEQKSRLIESFIINIPIPPIFLYEKDYSTYEVMDGLQRLSAISDFYKDKFKLCGLEFWVELNGKKYSELPSLVKKGIDRRFISAVILLKETAKNEEEAKMLKQIVFERINSGGTKLEYQESRNAFYSGKFSDLCKRLSRDRYFCLLFNIPQPSEEELANGEPDDELQKNDMFKKMKDVETIVRFFAMRYVDSFDMNLKIFLDRFTEQANKLPDNVIKNYDVLFRTSIKFTYDLLGEYPFGVWKLKQGEWEFQKNPNMFIYDPIMCVLSQYVENRDGLLKRKDEIRNGLERLIKDNDIFRDGRKGSKSDVKDRIDKFNAFIQKYL